MIRFNMRTLTNWRKKFLFFSSGNVVGVGTIWIKSNVLLQIIYIYRLELRCGVKDRLLYARLYHPHVCAENGSRVSRVMVQRQERNNYLPHCDASCVEPNVHFHSKRNREDHIKRLHGTWCKHCRERAPTHPRQYFLHYINARHPIREIQ